MGFGSPIQAKHEQKLHEILEQAVPKDLIKYGFIPEFVGRLPVVATLHELDEDALIRILTEPKNALVKQYTQLLEYEDVKFRATDDALSAIAEKVIEREAGARGLRAILEKIMLDTMYEIPSLEGVRECVVTADCVLNSKPPDLVLEDREALSA